MHELQIKDINIYQLQKFNYLGSEVKDEGKSERRLSKTKQNVEAWDDFIRNKERNAELLPS